jgi:cell wall-associated NlpC family hydrolase
VDYTYAQLETIWEDAGGPSDQAPVAAAHAEAESGGNPLAAYPGTTVAAGEGSWDDATGLWQILGKPATGKWTSPELTNPLDNAEMAVAKYKDAGDTWAPWQGDNWQKLYEPNVPPAPAVPGIPDPGGKGGTKTAAGFSVAKFVRILRKAIGDPYEWGGDSPSGFDCSGLVYWALTQLGYKNVPRTSEEQWGWVKRISKSQLKAGDLIFENFPGEQSPGHVLVYLGAGQAIQASQPGQPVAAGPWSPSTSGGTVVGYGRIPDMGGSGGNSGNTNVTLTGWNPVDGFLGSGGASSLSSIASSLGDFEKAIDFFFVPGHWIRIGAGIAGSFLIAWGLWAISRTGAPYSVNVPVLGAVPAPEGGQLAPALGIGAITLGSVCLFVCFHATPAHVTNFPSFLSYLQSEVKGGGSSAASTGVTA